MAETLATQYANSMQQHPYGYALFRPALSKVLKPGCCGYIDDQGKWNPILLDIQTPTASNFRASASLEPMDPQTLIWGPKTSADVSHQNVNFSGSADLTAAGFPAEVKLVMEFSTAKNFGAILHCSESVRERGFYHRNPFLSWAKANAQAIVNECPDVKDQGVWVVMSTFETQKVDINNWSGSQKKVSMGFTAAVPAAGEIGPSGSFVRGNFASGWNHDALDESQGSLVVFFTGVFLKYSYLPFGLDGLKSARAHRGESDDIVTVQDPDDATDSWKVDLYIDGRQLHASDNRSAGDETTTT